MTSTLTDDVLHTLPTVLAPDIYKDKTVLITGGGSGIGRATAWLAARLGAQVIIYGRKTEKVEGVSEAIRARGGLCDWGTLDIRDHGACATTMADVFERYGHLDLLINNAGGHFPGEAIDFTEKGWKAVIDNNLNGTFNMMQAGARSWRDAGRGGAIINITLIMRGVHNLSHSVASRSGVIAFSRHAAVEWAQYGIRVNCLSPGSIETEIWGDKERETYANGNPMRKVGTCWDIAENCLFLGSPAANFINGHDLQIDGGASLWGECWSAGKPEYLAEATRVWDNSPDLLERFRRCR
ncbi:MAG: SDR family oxidoreductase [Porticoccaceae bacterium]